MTTVKSWSSTSTTHPSCVERDSGSFSAMSGELAEGENILRIVAEDRHGNTARRDLIVIREIPKAVQLAERMRLTVMPFEQKGNVSDVSLSYQDNLLNALVKQNRFRVVEREKLDMILAEQKLSRTQLIEKDTALSLGKLVATQAIVTGSIIESRTGIEMVGRVVDTETSEILATEDVYTEERDLMALKRTAEGMAIKFHRDFPLVSGLVIDHKGRFRLHRSGEGQDPAEPASDRVPRRTRQTPGHRQADGHGPCDPRTCQGQSIDAGDVQGRDGGR